MHKKKHKKSFSEIDILYYLCPFCEFKTKEPTNLPYHLKARHNFYDSTEDLGEDI